MYDVAVLPDTMVDTFQDGTGDQICTRWGMRTCFAGRRSWPANCSRQIDFERNAAMHNRVFIETDDVHNRFSFCMILMHLSHVTGRSRAPYVENAMQ